MEIYKPCSVCAQKMDEHTSSGWCQTAVAFLQLSIFKTCTAWTASSRASSSAAFLLSKALEDSTSPPNRGDYIGTGQMFAGQELALLSCGHDSGPQNLVLPFFPQRLGNEWT